MAGKTSRGVGDEEEQLRLSREAAPLIADEDDARGLHSGPTVVDDAKVAEVLKKLRALDKKPGAPGAVAEVVLDPSSSGPTRLDSGPHNRDTAPAINLGPPSGIKADAGPASLQDIMYPLQRPTAIGRSLATPVVGQPVTVPADAARGTLFGRSIHLPDVNAPDDVAVEISSGSVQIDGAPTPSQPFPLADRPAIALPPPAGAPTGPMAQASAFADPDRRFHTPYDPEAHTQVVPTRSKWKPVAALLGGLSLVGVGWYAWTQVRGDDASSAAAPPPPAATPPAIVPLPSPAAATAPAPAEPAAAAPASTPGAPAAAAPAATAGAPAAAAPTAAAPAAAASAPPAGPPADEPSPAAQQAAKKAPTPPGSAAPAAKPERRAPARAASAADEPRPSPSRPSRSRRRASPAAPPEDPDDTLPPSL